MSIKDESVHQAIEGRSAFQKTSFNLLWHYDTTMNQSLSFIILNCY